MRYPIKAGNEYDPKDPYKNVTDGGDRLAKIFLKQLEEKNKKEKMKEEYTFITLELEKETWKKFSLLDKIRTKILFKIILPKSKFILKEEVK